MTIGRRPRLRVGVQFSVQLAGPSAKVFDGRGIPAPREGGEGVVDLLTGPVGLVIGSCKVPQCRIQRRVS